jgi:DNA polymerase-3 subunit alpha
VEYLPLNRPTKGDADDSPVDRVSQWPMEIVDAMGMLKVDFLGLRTLTHMRKACELIHQEQGRELDLETIPYERYPDDPEKDEDVMALYRLLATGETTGVFQVEGAGMRRTLRELRPEQFQHIIAVLALYRPGPMENIPTYIRRMHGEEEVEYHHPILADILGDTYGIIVYQEQIMQIAVAMAGYKPGEADMIRKAVAKKKKKLMEKHQKMFRKGAIERGIDGEIADRVWADIEFFARYGFNRAHATDYAVITAQTAYLKAHYPLEFMTALMTTERHNTEKLGFLIADARRNDLEVAQPSINHSGVEFTIEHDEDGERFIRIGLGAIKNVGDDAMKIVVEAREEGGAFKTLDDFADRVDLRKLNRKTLECLIQAGALDDFGERPALMTLIDALLSTSAQVHGAREVGQFMLFDNMEEMRQTIQPPSFVPPIPDRQLLEWEKELLGTYLSKHPLTDQERDLMAQQIITTTIGQHTTESPGQALTMVGMVQRVRRITTKKGDPMAFVTLEGSGGTVDCVVFPRTYERFKGVVIPSRILVVNGKLDNSQDRDEPSLLVEWFKEPHEFLRAAGGPTSVATDDTFASSSREPAASYTAAPSRTTPAQGNDQSGNGANDNGSSQKKSNGNGNGHRTAPASRETATAPASQDEDPASKPSNGGNGSSNRTYAPPPEPPSPPATLYITLKRTGDNMSDFQKLSQIHEMLKTEQGMDQFVVLLESANRERIKLEFPNERTRCTRSLEQQITSLVGAGNLRVVQESHW